MTHKLNLLARTNIALTDIRGLLKTVADHMPSTFDYYIGRAPATVPDWFIPDLEHLQRPVKPDPSNVPIKFHNARLAWERAVQEHGPDEAGTLSDVCCDMGLLPGDAYNDMLVTYEGLYCEWWSLEQRYQILAAEETAFQWPIVWAVAVLNKRNKFLGLDRKRGAEEKENG